MSRRISDIEVLRGLAVFAVVLHHSFGNLFTWTTPGLSRVNAYFMGGFGVDLFFAISGFVIARDLIPRLQASRGGEEAMRITLAFWIRRAWRLLPSAWLWLAIVLLASVLFNQTEVFGSFRTNLEATVAGVLQVANIRFAETFMQSPYGASFVYWSLSLEEQFYLLLPILVLLSRGYLPHVLIALVLYQWFSERSLLMAMFRTDAIALGVLLALWCRRSTYDIAKPTFLKDKYWLAACILLGLYLCMGIIGSDVLHVVNHRFTLHAIIAAILVWMASYDMSLFLPWRPLNSVLLWIGARSYAIYLIHIPAYFMTREIWARLDSERIFNDTYFWHFTLTATALTLLLSELNYRLIENPLRLHGAAVAKRFTKQEPPTCVGI